MASGKLKRKAKQSTTNQSKSEQSRERKKQRAGTVREPKPKPKPTPKPPQKVGIVPYGEGGGRERKTGTCVFRGRSGACDWGGLEARCVSITPSKLISITPSKLKNFQLFPFLFFSLLRLFASPSPSSSPEAEPAVNDLRPRREFAVAVDRRPSPPFQW